MEKALRDYSIQELRTEAKSLGIKAGKDWDAAKFIKSILQKKGPRVVARVVEDQKTPVPDGHARIRLSKTNEGFSGPVEVMLNKTRHVLPRDKVIDVPYQIVTECLDHSENYRTEDPPEPERGREAGQSRRVAEPAYPYSLLGMGDQGVSVVHGVNSESKQALRRLYKKMNKRWPTGQQEAAFASEETQAMRQEVRAGNYPRGKSVAEYIWDKYFADEEEETTEE